MWFVLWYLSGLVGYLMTDYVECKIVNRTYERELYDSKSTTVYLEGVRPPAYLVFPFALLGVICLVVGVRSMYNYLKGNYGEF